MDRGTRDKDDGVDGRRAQIEVIVEDVCGYEYFSQFSWEEWERWSCVGILQDS